MPVCGKCHQEASAGAAACPACGASLDATATERDTGDGLSGRTLRGVYLVQEKIADGAMGAVYKAVHTALDAPFAVKVLKQVDPGVVARFRQEARALSRLRHPNVVAVTDFGQTEDGTLFVVMEYVSGKSLARVIADEAPLPERRVVRIGAQILAALAEAHARQLLHGALSPNDVMLESRRDPPDSVKVLDFGVAGLHLAGALPSAATQAGLKLATPAYMSPEQREGGDLDARSDLYAAGVVLYEMLTATLPVDPAAPPAGARRAELPPPPSARVARPVSPELESLVMRALSPHRFERPESAAEMREELLRCPIAEPQDLDADECGPTVVLPRSTPPQTPLPSGERTPPPTPRPTPPRATARTTPRGTERATPRPAEHATTPRGTQRATPRTSERSTPRGTRQPAAAAAFGPDVLQAIQRRALPILGPVAPYLVAKAGAVATSVEELCEIVASFIPSDADRARFLAGSGAGTRTRAAPRERTRTAIAWDPALLELARRELAVHMGPVARVVVQRASATARSPEDLCELLAGQITDEEGRAAFRRAMSRHGR
jgi:serine/threonine-protein kinase